MHHNDCWEPILRIVDTFFESRRKFHLFAPDLRIRRTNRKDSVGSNDAWRCLIFFSGRSTIQHQHNITLIDRPSCVPPSLPSFPCCLRAHYNTPFRIHSQSETAWEILWRFRFSFLWPMGGQLMCRLPEGPRQHDRARHRYGPFPTWQARRRHPQQ